MTQRALPIKYEIENTNSKVTANAGLPLYMELMQSLAFDQVIDTHVGVRKDCQGWTDSQIIMSLILLNLAGGDCVADIDVLHDDPGLRAVIRNSAFYGKTRKERRKIVRRWRKGTERVLPSQSAIFRYLKLFHDPQQEKLRKPQTAFIPESKSCLTSLYTVNKTLIEAAQKKNPVRTMTLDIDATLIASDNENALPCYKGFCSYQPLNVYSAAHDMMLYSEFRDGNVPAGYEQKRVFEESLDYVPEGVKKIQVRSDTAGYEWEFLKYCAEGHNKRFGVIDFAVAADVTPAFKTAVAEIEENDWHTLLHPKTGEPTNQQWAEVCFVPNELARTKKGPHYRYIAIREKLSTQLPLPGCEDVQYKLPFPTIHMGDGDELRQYKLTAIVTNLDWAGELVIHWLRKRCGKSEEVHSVIKTDMAGGHIPSQLFGANAAWWGISILAVNIHVLFKTYCLGGNLVSKRLKAVRFHIINRTGRIVFHARELIIRVSEPFMDLIVSIRANLEAFHPLGKT